MSDLMNYARELVEDIGPRPVNTEEEQQSAQKIAGWFNEKNANPQIEEFSCPTWVEWPYVVSYLLMALAAALTYFHGVVGIVTLILALCAVGLFVYERYFNGALADRFKKGMSQNVVTKYVPRSLAGDTRRRKVIIVAHYDTERTSLEAAPSFIDGYPALQKIIFGCLVAIPVLMVVQMLPFELIRKWVWLFSCFVAVFPVGAAVSLLLRKFALPYCDGANNNASGVAVMMGVFDRIIPDALKERFPDEKTPVVHDEEKVRGLGIVSADTKVTYESERPSSSVRVTGRGQEGEKYPLVERPKASVEGSVQAAAAAAAAAVTEGAVLGARSGEVAKTAGTGAVNAHRVSRDENVQARREAERRRSASDVPEWWAKVESKRKSALDTEDAEEAFKARSRYADVPDLNYRRPEPEPEPEPEPTPEHVSLPEPVPTAEPGFTSRSEVDSEQPVAPLPGSISEEPPKSEFEDKLDELADKILKSDRQLSGMTDMPIEENERRYQRYASAYAPEVADTPVLEQAIDEVPSGVEPIDFEPKNRRLMNLPSIEDDSFAGLDMLKTSAPAKNPSLIDDESFGTLQASPISSEYYNTPQKTGFTDEFAPLSSFDDFEEQEPLVTDEFSPFAAGSFGAGETGAFIPVGNTEAFSPVMMDEDEDIFIGDADDSSLQTMPTVGDFNAPASIDIPESRAHKLVDGVSDFFSRKKKKKGKEKSTSEWLGVDEDYSATSAGREIGSWDNFGEDDQDADTLWKGGAAAYPGDDLAGSDETSVINLRRDVKSMVTKDLLESEVWFVALGAHGAGNAGMKDFLARHASELSGSLIINVDCVGAGEICYLESEGLGRSYRSDYRAQSLIRKLAREVGGNVEIETMKWASTDATPALRAGIRAITIMGFDKKAPVAWNQKADDMSILEPSRLELATDLITEIVRKS